MARCPRAIRNVPRIGKNTTEVGREYCVVKKSYVSDGSKKKTISVIVHKSTRKRFISITLSMNATEISVSFLKKHPEVMSTTFINSKNGTAAVKSVIIFARVVFYLDLHMLRAALSQV